MSYLRNILFLLQNNENDIKGLNGRNANAGNAILPLFELITLTSLIKSNKNLKVFIHSNFHSNFLGVSSNANLRFEEQLRSFYTPLNQYDFVGTDAKNHREISDNFEQKTRNRRDINEVPKEKVRFSYSDMKY